MNKEMSFYKIKKVINLKCLVYNYFLRMKKIKN